MNFRERPYPEIIVASASAAWGFFWIPLRAIESQGLAPAWATLSQFLVPFAVLIPFAVNRRIRGQPSGIKQYRSGLLIGSAVALYLESLLLTDVARALILFYAMPAWGTILEVGLMKRPMSRWRALSLLLSLSGMLAILGAGNSFSFSMNFGDLLALASGILFAFGAMQVRKGGEGSEISVFEQVFAFFLYGSLAAAILSLLPLLSPGRLPSLELLIVLAPWFALIAVGFLIPVMWGVYWGSRHVDPGRLGILLQLEAVVGIGSAALLAGEPFGARQALGALLVISAGLVEVIGNNRGATKIDLSGQ